VKFLQIFCFLLTSAFCFGQTHNLVTNLQYRLTQGDLAELAPAPFAHARTLGIEHGGDALLQECLDHPLKWTQDRMLFRLAHRHAASSTSCRERTSPSMHVVFYPLADGSRETRIHFDLHGPRNPIGHFGEVVRNRLTFGRTSEYAVYRGLVKRRGDPDVPVPLPAYDVSAHATDFYKAAFGPGAIAGAMFTGSAWSVISRDANWGHGRARYTNHIEANLTRNALRQSIEFGVGAALQQDETYAISQEDRLGVRMRAALFHSLFVPGRGGHELAFPRIAAALGTSWITHEWHPWCQQAPDPWLGTALILSRYVLTSYWREFRPDIKHHLLKNRQALQHKP
jgi:hypothetical protein